MPFIDKGDRLDWIPWSQSKKESELNLAIANLRHLYKQMLAGEVKNTESAAKKLLGPAIEALEKWSNS